MREGEKYDCGGITLVNGYVTGSKYSEHAGLRFGHAWIELADGLVCHDSEVGVSVPRSTYYDMGGINEADCIRYSYGDCLEWIDTLAEKFDGEVFLPFELEPSPYELSLGIPYNCNNG
jgi:hypothetical protein